MKSLLKSKIIWLKIYELSMNQVWMLLAMKSVLVKLEGNPTSMKPHTTWMVYQLIVRLESSIEFIDSIGVDVNSVAKDKRIMKEWLREMEWLVCWGGNL